MNKNFRTRALTAFNLAPLMLAATFAEDANQAEAAATGGGGEAPSTEAAEAKAKRAPASNFLAIVRGRFPLLFVHAVRFDEVLGKIGNKDLATKLATSVGKIFDIRKGRNFAYLTKDYKPTQEDVAGAEAWIAQVGAQNAKGVTATGDVALMKQLVEQYKAAGLGTAEDAAKLSAARGETRAKPTTSPSGAAGTAAASLPTSTASAASKAGSADELLG